MTIRIPRHLPTLLLAFAIFFGLLGAEIRCTTAEARPSLEGLQAQIDEINASELRVIDGDGLDLGKLVGWSQRRFAGTNIDQTAAVYIESVNAVAHVMRNSGFLNESEERVWFAEPGCVGPGYVAMRNASVLVALDDHTRFFASIEGSPAEQVDVVSDLTFAFGCIPHTGTVSNTLVAAQEVTDIVGPLFPVPLPISVVPVSSLSAGP